MSSSIPRVVRFGQSAIVESRSIIVDVWFDFALPPIRYIRRIVAPTQRTPLSNSPLQIARADFVRHCFPPYFQIYVNNFANKTRLLVALVSELLAKILTGCASLPWFYILSWCLFLSCVSTKSLFRGLSRTFWLMSINAFFGRLEMMSSQPRCIAKVSYYMLLSKYVSAI